MPRGKRARVGTPLLRSLCLSNIPAFAVAMPVLANELYPGVIGSQIPFLCLPDFTGHAPVLQLLGRAVQMAGL